LSISHTKPARPAVVLAVVFAAGIALALAGASGGHGARVAATAGPHPLLGIVGDPARFKSQTGQDSTVQEAFLGWGQGQTFGAPFKVLFSTLGTVPMIHLGTGNRTGHEQITPGSIASGKGDSYLIALNHAIATWGKAIYVRPMAEMNNAANFYSAYNVSGSLRDSAHSTASYRKAFERIYVILHGGSATAVDARLKALGMPPVPAGVANQLYPNPFPTLRIIWSPLASSNPRVAGNAASAYYPGAGYVDVEGGDIYDEMLTDTAPWNGLESLYSAAAARHKPFSVPEWGLSTVDDPAFVKHMCTFLQTHRSTEVAVYYESHPGSPYDLGTKPSSRAAYSQCITPLAGPLPSWVGSSVKLIALKLTPSPAAGSSPLSVKFNVVAKLSQPIADYQLLFGDGASVQGAGPPPSTISHTYSKDGVYQPLLFVYRNPPFDPADATFYTSAEVTAGTGPTPFVSFVPTPSSGGAPLSVSFRTDLTIGATPTGWTINWGDGTSRTGTGAPPHFTGHTFEQGGTFGVALIVNASGGRQYGALAQVTASGGPGPPSTTTTTTTTSTTGSPPATGQPTGTVLVNGVPFTGGQVPPGSTIDVTKGDILVTTTTGHFHLFGSGVPSKFKLLRGKSAGKLVTLVDLVGGNFAQCGKTKKGIRQVAGLATQSKPKTTTVRQLWGNGKGNFETQGRYAAATVRGTYWLTRDRCDGTLIIVKRGIVAVFDKKTHKTVLVRAPHSLFIPA
jgi:hypothetical protein